MADPTTCLHRLIRASRSHDHTTEELICCSCGTSPTSDHWVGKQYEYDPTNFMWVQVGPSRRVSMRELHERRRELERRQAILSRANQPPVLQQNHMYVNGKHFERTHTDELGEVWIATDDMHALRQQRIIDDINRRWQQQWVDQPRIHDKTGD